jgi:hypothetical protein
MEMPWAAIERVEDVCRRRSLISAWYRLFHSGPGIQLPLRQLVGFAARRYAGHPVAGVSEAPAAKRGRLSAAPAPVKYLFEMKCPRPAKTP